MKINDYGQVIITANEAFQSLYTGKINTLELVLVDDDLEISKYNSAKAINADRISDLHYLPKTDLSVKDFDKLNQSNWFMPDEYKDFEIVGFLLDQTQNEEQYQRVVDELVLYFQYNMIDVLKYCKYLVDTMRENNIVWGVGRGSSVASYCLYLLGIHKIDSIKFELDVNEFLKNNVAEFSSVPPKIFAAISLLIFKNNVGNLLTTASESSHTIFLSGNIFIISSIKCGFC